MIATTIASVADADADYAVWTCTFGVAGASAAMMRSTAADSRHAFAIACSRAASGANATTEGPEPETKACVAPACNAARTLGALTAAVTAGMPFGSVMAGYLGQSMPLPLAFAIIGGCYAGVFVLTGFGRHWRRFDESFRHATEV